MPAGALYSSHLFSLSALRRGKGRSPAGGGVEEGKRDASSSNECTGRLSSPLRGSRCAFWSSKATDWLTGPGDGSWRAGWFSPATAAGSFGHLTGLNESVDTVRVLEVERRWQRTLILFYLALYPCLLFLQGAHCLGCGLDHFQTMNEVQNSPFEALCSLERDRRVQELLEPVYQRRRQSHAVWLDVGGCGGGRGWAD